VLEEGVLCHLAVRTPWGPHLTPVVFVLDGGRLWLTTSRRSVKARTWKDDPFIGGLVVTGDRAVSFHGRVRTYDALDPLSWPAATVAGPRLVSAATKFSLKNARFFAGYAVDARRVPLAWTPPGRVFARIDLSAGWLLSIPDGSVLERWGERTGRRRTSFRASFEPLGRTRPLDLRVPRDVRSAGGPGGQAPLALDEGIGPPVVLPARWRRVAAEGTYEAAVPRALVDLAGPGAEAPGALTVDRASVWRAADMVGMLIQGRADLYAPGATRRGTTALRERAARLGGPAVDDLVLIRLLPSRVVWWRGWTSGTVARA